MQIFNELSSSAHHYWSLGILKSKVSPEANSIHLDIHCKNQTKHIKQLPEQNTNDLGFNIKN